MEILTEEQKELLRSQRSGLDVLKWQLSELSATYSLKGGELLTQDKKSNKGRYMIGISNNLNFGMESIDIVNERGKEILIELKRAKDKIYGQMIKIDQQTEEIKRLKKLIDELKKNIEL